MKLFVIHPLGHELKKKISFFEKFVMKNDFPLAWNNLPAISSCEKIAILLDFILTKKIARSVLIYKIHQIEIESGNFMKFWCNFNIIILLNIITAITHTIFKLQLYLVFSRNISKLVVNL